MGRSEHSFWGFDMRWTALSLIGMLLSSASLAQDQPKSVRTQKVQAPSLESTSIYTVEPDGTVKIDWDAVETLASSKADRTMSPFAEVMLAIRDKTWQPMGK